MIRNFSKKKSIWKKFPILIAIKKKNRFPNHVFVIPDGNGRWAKIIKHGPPTVGHKVAVKIIENLLDDIIELPIKYFTVWGFACDNWKRSEKEITELMTLFNKMINNVLPKLEEKNSRFFHLGRKDRIPKKLLKTIKFAEKKTEKNLGQVFSVAIDYGGEDQELRAMQKLVKLNLPKETIVTEELRQSLLDNKDIIPPIDLIIRTSGEYRISDVGQLSRNAEFVFVKKFFPEFTIKDAINSIVDYSKRERRFGSRKK
jgi:undecaprenyl diphosphate synthase